jgi:transcriptional regulator with XRE-family HTH domain
MDLQPEFSSNETPEPTENVSLPTHKEALKEGSLPGFQRARSSLRQRYEAEARVIEKRLGGLESVRESLGLSQRKMAQLLLVDPSAWTRWTSGDAAPPHIWRALAWYLALQDKYPALDAAFWLQGVARAADGDRISQNADEIRAGRLQTRSLELKVQELMNELESLNARQKSLGTSGEIAESLDDESRQKEQRAQVETRALANFFLAVTFAALGYVIAVYLAK